MRHQPRKFWLGMSAGGWFRLLARNRLAVNPRSLPEATAIGLLSINHSLLRIVERWRLADRWRNLRLPDNPIFIVGHWRSGTTHLHNLMSRDARFVWPTTYECMNPNHFLLTEKLDRRLIDPPSRRPMDRVAISLDDPQEDEFALCNLGLPSPYLKSAFPNRPEPWPEALAISGLSPSERRRWETGFVDFLQRVQLRHPDGIPLLKSPTHSARIPVLRALFPAARFVHIVRSPHDVIPSTMNLWRKFWPILAMQTPDFSGLEDFVFARYAELMEKLEQDWETLPDGDRHRLRFEDLDADPHACLARIYTDLQLGDFGEAAPAITAYLESVKRVCPTDWGATVSPALRARIAAACASQIQRYGYA